MIITPYWQHLMSERSVQWHLDFTLFTPAGLTVPSDVWCMSCGTFFPMSLTQLHRQSSPCPTCRVIAASGRFATRVEDIWGEGRWDVSEAIYNGSQYPIDVYCLRHQRFCTTIPANFLRHMNPCPDCQKEKRARPRRTYEEWVAYMEEVWGKDRWIFPDTPPAWPSPTTSVICAVHHTTCEVEPPLFAKRTNPCPDCKREGDSRFWPHDKRVALFRAKAEECYGGRAIYSDSDYTCANKPIHVTCDTCGAEVDVTPMYLLAVREFCPRCRRDRRNKHTNK